jgi:hypothetical protein
LGKLRKIYLMEFNLLGSNFTNVVFQWVAVHDGNAIRPVFPIPPKTFLYWEIVDQ